jgi:hypothetical protein
MGTNTSDYDSKPFKSYKKFKDYQEKVKEKENERKSNEFIEEKFFPCFHCGKINLFNDIINEEPENRTMRARYVTWKKFKTLANEMGGSLENCLNYLLSLHEGLLSGSKDYDVPIAGFGGGDEGKKKKK